MAIQVKKIGTLTGHNGAVYSLEKCANSSHFFSGSSDKFLALWNLDTLQAETPNLPANQNKQLFDGLLQDYEHISNKRARMLAIKEDPYYNALQIKFAYAVTCHKAQGGQWDAVFVDQGYLTEEMIDLDFLRWLYTAVTRAKKELFLVNFAQNLFSNVNKAEDF